MADTQIFCHDYGDAKDCLGAIDEQYTMRFDEVGEEPLYFCSVCGKRAQWFESSIMKAFAERPEFFDEFKAAIEKAQARQVKQ